MPTMSQVAREAGVSTTTVSHVLNGTRHVNAKTSKRVHAAIKRIGYRPQSIARGLAGAPTHSIGVAMNGISNPYIMNVIAAVEAEAARCDHTILLGDTHDQADKELEMVQDLVSRRVDGLLLAPSPEAQNNAPTYLAQQSASVPVVLVDRFLPVAVDQVGTENEQPTAELVNHLLELGHRRVGFVTGLEGLSTTDERIHGYRLAIENADIPFDDELVAYGASEHDQARAAVHDLLKLADPPTALVAANNAMTIGALRALRECGKTVPDDIVLVAFDDFEWSDLFHPRLTVVAQPTDKIGKKAVELLLARLKEPSKPTQPVRLKPQLVHRESCGCKDGKRV